MNKSNGIIIALSILCVILITSVYLQWNKKKVYISSVLPLEHTKIEMPNIKIINEDPFIMVIEDFMNTDECDHFVKISQDRFDRSKVVSETSNISNARTSYSATIKTEEDDIVKEIENRARIFTHSPVSNIEPLQVVRYNPGQEYKEHYDLFIGEDSLNELKKAGQRKSTIFVYLNDVEEGGCTYFPKLDIRIQPKKGRAVFWLNRKHDGEDDLMTKHCGEPPIKGTKYGLNIWSRIYEFPK